MTSNPLNLFCPVPAAAGDRITLAHGGGGLHARRLIDGLFRPAFGHSSDDFTHDGAVMEMGDAQGAPRNFAFTTDTYVIKPLFFPGGDIGALAVNGTVNDLAMCGAVPLCLSAGLVIEEGFPLSDLERIVRSMRDAALAVGARIVTGDTKVVERGKGDGLYINTSGIGRVLAPQPVSPREVRPGDLIVLSGDIGRHGIAVMAVREGLDFETRIESDCAPLAAKVSALMAAGLPVRCLRDPTRGGLATALIEIALAANVTMRLDAEAVPVSGPVRGACEILGLDPLYVANEGRFIAILPPGAAQEAVSILGGDACVIGAVERAGNPGSVGKETPGGRIALDLLSGDPLPRIC